MKLLSPPGLAGIAVLAVSPSERAAVLAALESPSGAPCHPVAGQASMRAVLKLAGRVVDDVLVVVRSGGELELHVHGSPAVIEQLDQHFGIAVQEPDSPAQRLLLEALSEQQFALAAEQLGYDFEVCLAALRELPELARRVALTAACERSRIAKALVEPERVVLIGQQNAGKSSLFNLLLFRERALTGATPGLTRDAIAERTTLAGYPYELVDTAGEGIAATALDAAAIASGQNWRKGARLVLVVDGARGPSGSDWELARISELVIATKADLPQAVWPCDLVRDALLATEGSLAESARLLVGRLLAQRRSLPVLLHDANLVAKPAATVRLAAHGRPAGAVGGFAAMDEDQRQRLFGLDADCSTLPPSA